MSILPLPSTAPDSKGIKVTCAGTPMQYSRSDGNVPAKHDNLFCASVQMQYIRPHGEMPLLFNHVVCACVQMQYSRSDGGVPPRYDEGEDMVRQLQANQTGVDDRLRHSDIQLFKNRQLGSAVLDNEMTQAGDNAEEPEEDDAEEGESGEGESDEDESEADESKSDEEEDNGLAGPRFTAMPQEVREVSRVHFMCYLLMLLCLVK